MPGGRGLSLTQSENASKSNKLTEDNRSCFSPESQLKFLWIYDLKSLTQKIHITEKITTILLKERKNLWIPPAKLSFET